MTSATTQSPTRLSNLQRLETAPLLGLGLLFFFALGVRVFYLYEIHDSILFETLVGDGRSFDAWAQRLVAGERETQGFYQAPFYPYFLASIYQLYGAHDTLIVRVVQVVFGAFSCVLIAGATASLFSKRAGAIAGFMLAIYPLSFYFDGLIQKTSMAQFFGALLLYLLVRSATTVRVDLLRALAIGLTLGALSLLRENSLALAPICLAWLWLQGATPERTKRCLLMMLGLALAISPAAWRNYESNGVALPTSYNFGTNLYIGNHKGAPGYYTPLKLGRGDAAFERHDAHQVAERESGRALTPAEVSRFFTAAAVADIKEDFSGWLRLLAYKWALVFNAEEISDTDTWRAYADTSIALAVGGAVFHFGVLCPLAAFGLIATWKDRRQLWVLYLMLLAMAASVSLFFVFGRYRLPLVLILVPFAAAGAASLQGWKRWPRSRLIAGVAAAAATALVVNWPINPIDTDPRAVTYNSIGLIERGEGRVDRSVALFNRALEIEPDLWWARVNLANTLRGQGKFKQSLPHYKRALAARQDPNVGGEFALALVGLDQVDRALPVLEQAARVSPDNVAFLMGLGIAHTRRGELEIAEAQFRRVLTLDPQNEEARKNLRRLLVRMGRAPAKQE